jgi:hypothetical protein
MRTESDRRGNSRPTVARIASGVFSPYGVAYFSTSYEESNQFLPILYKMWNDWDNPDKGAWRFSRDLPLWLSDLDGNFLVASCWWELD